MFDVSVMYNPPEHRYGYVTRLRNPSKIHEILLSTQISISNIRSVLKVGGIHHTHLKNSPQRSS